MQPDDKSTDKVVNKYDKIGYWLKWIKASKAAAKTHWEDTQAAYDEYEFKSIEQGDNKPKRLYPIYKTCSDKLSTALYGQTPKSRSKRLHGIDDPMALTMALINDRLGDSLMHEGNFDEAMIAAVYDLIHGAKATNQVIYATDIEKVRMPLQIMQAEGKEDVYYQADPTQPYEGEVKKDNQGYFGYNDQAVESTQKIILAPACFDEMLHTPEAKNPSEVTERAFKFCIDYEDAEAMFNTNRDGTKKGLALPYSTSKSYSKDDKADSSENKNRMPGRVLEGWECYCLETRTKYWVNEEFASDFLLTEKDPEGLRNFFPCPPEILQNKPGKSMYPTPNWVYLEATANSLNVLYARIIDLLSGIRRRAIVFGASPELIAALNDIGDQEFISVADTSDALQKATIDDKVWWVPVQELVAAITEAMQLEEYFKNLFSEWFKLPDILRGISDPNETAAAQEIKVNEAHDSFQYIRKQVADLARDSLELMLDYAYKVYSDDKIAKIVGYEFMPKGTPGIPPSQENPQGEPPQPGHFERFPEALARLRNDQERLVRIDFETDSTSFKDEQKEIARAQMISDTVIKGLSIIGQIENQSNYNIAMSTFLGVLEAMGGTSATEDMIRKTVADIEKAKNAPPPPPPPDYEKMKLDIQSQKNQLDAQAKGRELDIKQQDLQIKEQGMQITQLKTVGDQALAQFEAQNKAKIDQIFAALEQQRVQLEAASVAIEKYKAQTASYEAMLEEIRLKQESDAAVNETATTAATTAEPNLPAPPTIIQMAPQPAPALNIHFNMPKAGKRTSTMIHPDGTQTTIESSEGEDPGTVDPETGPGETGGLI